MRPIYLSLGVVVSLLLFVSERSGYSLHGDVETMNWDVALMLSPIGLIRNLFIEPASYLRPYYFEVSGRGALLEDPVLVLLICALGAAALAGLICLRKALVGTK